MSDSRLRRLGDSAIPAHSRLGGDENRFGGCFGALTSRLGARARMRDFCRARKTEQESGSGNWRACSSFVEEPGRGEGGMQAVTPPRRARTHVVEDKPDRVGACDVAQDDDTVVRQTHPDVPRQDPPSRVCATCAPMPSFASASARSERANRRALNGLLCALGPHTAFALNSGYFFSFCSHPPLASPPLMFPCFDPPAHV